MTEQPAEDAWADVQAPERPEDAWADIETTVVPVDDSVPVPPVEDLSGEPENDSDTQQPQVEGFQLSTADVVALVNDRSDEKMSVSTFRTLVAHGEAPPPLTWGRPPLWSFSAIEDWIAEMFARGAFTLPVVMLEVAEAESEQAAQQEPELVFGSTAQWVEEFLVPMYRRDIAPNGAGTLTWCPQWWEHAEAIIRLEALWRAWEHLRLDGKTGMSVFMKDHLDHHMPTLMAGKGPFDGCSLAKGHVGQMKPVTLVPAPPELFPDARQQVTNTKES